MQREAAETLAIRALGWLAAQDDIWPMFTDATGTSAGDIRAAAADPEFLAGVLDFLMQDDAWVMAFCEASGLRYAEPMAARQALPGGVFRNWT